MSSSRAQRGRFAPPSTSELDAVAGLLTALRKPPLPESAIAIASLLHGQSRLAGVTAYAVTQSEIDIQEAAQAITRLLQWTQAAEDTVAGVTASRDERGAALLALIAAQPLDQKIAKHVRTALHSLEGAGIHPPNVPATSAEPIFQVPTSGVEFERALANYIDAEGARTLALFQARRPVGAGMAFAILHERDGLTFLQTFGGTRRQLGRQWEDILTDPSSDDSVDIPFSYAQWLLAEAAQRSTSVGRHIPDQYNDWIQFTGGEPQGVSPENVYREAEWSDDLLEQHLAASGKMLIAAVELDGWSITPPDVESDGGLLTGDGEQTAQAESAFDTPAAALIDALFTEEYRQCYARRCEETALLFVRTQRPENALSALATAKALHDPSRQPSSIPLCQELVKRGLALRAELSSLEERAEVPAARESDEGS
ncbi:MAG: hypothetical protein M1118_06070 [Chloroflexi bacterium]|nr:hypothetical protein [Chloroflexota bacterium]